MEREAACKIEHIWGLVAPSFYPQADQEMKSLDATLDAITRVRLQKPINKLAYKNNASSGFKAQNLNQHMLNSFHPSTTSIDSPTKAPPLK